MLDKKYDHKIVEENKYDFWKDNGFFEAGKDKSKVPFCVVIPPPNVLATYLLTKSKKFQ